MKCKLASVPTTILGIMIYGFWKDELLGCMCASFKGYLLYTWDSQIVKLAKPCAVKLIYLKLPMIWKSLCVEAGSFLDLHSQNIVNSSDYFVEWILNELKTSGETHMPELKFFVQGD